MAYVVEYGFRPGVTDNKGRTAREIIKDLLKEGEQVFSSQMMLLSGKLSRTDAINIGESVANPLIQSIRIKDYSDFRRYKGMDVVVPKVKLEEKPHTDIVSILEADDLELQRIGKLGIFDHNDKLSRKKYESLIQLFLGDELKLGDLFEKDEKYFQKIRRGPLALDLICMKAIQEHYKDKGRNPTDIEVESEAQTWSEHCKHTIFADPIDDIQDGLFNHFIKAATERIRKEKGEKGCLISSVSVSPSASWPWSGWPARHRWRSAAGTKDASAAALKSRLDSMAQL